VVGAIAAVRFERRDARIQIARSSPHHDKYACGVAALLPLKLLDPVQPVLDARDIPLNLLQDLQHRGLYILAHTMNDSTPPDLR
jgi:hypothetical protein